MVHGGVAARGRGGQYTTIDKVFRDEAAREARMEDRLFQRLENRFDSFLECFDAMIVGNRPQNRQPKQRLAEEDTCSEDDITNNPFTDYPRRVRGQVMVPVGFFGFRMLVL
ncbi:unnamed protein product [Camellia sinensis]